MIFLKRGSIKIIRKTVSQIIEVVKFTSKDVVINAATVLLAELIANNGTFCNAWGLLLKVERPSFPP